MRNNNRIIDQIRAKVLEDYGAMIRREPKSEIKFFVRDSTVQKTYPTEKFVYKGNKVVLDQSEHGMTEENIEVFLMLIENALLRSNPIDYAHIRIDYALNQKRTDFGDFCLEVENERHYPKKK